MSPDQFLQIANLLPEPAFLVDGAGNILAANQAVERLGLVHARAPGSVLTSWTENASDEVGRYLSLCARSRTPVIGSLTFLNASGTATKCRVMGAVIRPASDSYPSLIFLRCLPLDTSISRFLTLNEKLDALAKEVKRRQLAEDDMRRQKEWLQVTLQSIGDAVIATSPSGHIVFMNPVAQAYLGWSEEEAAGRPLKEVFRIVNEYTGEPVDSPVSEVIRRGVVVGLANHTLLIHRDGSRRPIEDSAAPILNQRGELLGVILVFHDVTQQRTAERELMRSARRKDEFLAMLAHELRNPLAPIRNAVAILKQLDVGSDEHALHARETIDRQLNHMVRLIDDLLDISRINQGKFELRKQRVELGAVLSQAVETCQPVVESSGHRLTVKLPEVPVYAEADPVRLCQAFTNLLNNACKFTLPGGRIELLADVSGSELAVQVRDSGVGIQKEYLTSIFEMFSQVDSTLERSQGGLGIGLTLAKQIVELHRGSIDVRSEGPGMGSEFIIRLPTTSEAAPRQNDVVERPPQHAQLKILVVDDNQDAAETLALLMRFEGHSTCVAYDGQQALIVAEQQRPDIALLDIGLPKMDGYVLCQNIRQTPWGRGILIVAITGWGQHEDRKKTAEAGFDYHFTKPVEISMLRDLIEQCGNCGG